MRIDQALDLGHSAITIQEDVRQSCGLSKLYSVRQPATCFVVKSSKKARAFGSSLFTIATFLSIFRAYGSELIDSGVRNTTRLLPTDGPTSLPHEVTTVQKSIRYYTYFVLLDTDQ